MGRKPAEPACNNSRVVHKKELQATRGLIWQ